MKIFVLSCLVEKIFYRALYVFSGSILPHQLQDFFVGWPNPPSPEKHRELLGKSDFCLLAIDETTTMVVGFITAITDHVLSAYIPLLEVLPSYQGQGIGTELVRRMFLCGYSIIYLLLKSKPNEP